MYGTGSTITIIEFAIWPHLPKILLLNHAIKTRPTVHLLRKYYVNVLGVNRVGTGCKIQNEFDAINITKTNTGNCQHTPSALLSAKAKGMGQKPLSILLIINLLNQVKRQKHLVDSNDVDGMLMHFMCTN